MALPVQTVLLIDESGSMKGAAMTAASAAAASYIDTMRAGDTAAVEAFNDQFHTLQRLHRRQGGLSRLRSAV